MKVGESRFHITLLEDLGMLEVNGKRHRYGVFQCHCGNIKEMKISSVNNYRIRSWGCLSKNQLVYTKESNTLLYHVYNSMIERCHSKTAHAYKDYGARGIQVCRIWRNSYASFKAWALENGYKKGLQLDRIDNDGNYEPNNCQWITSAENNSIGKKRMNKNNKTGYNGVQKRRNKFIAQIGVDNKNIALGSFDTLEEAVESRIEAEIKYLGEQKTNLHYIKN